MKKVVLAYSGGLDTSVILTWLIERGYEVVAYIADVGQNEDLDAARDKALRCGASRAYVEDLKREFLTQYIFTALRGGTLYEGRYLLGTSIARPVIAKKQVEIALQEEAQFLAHGATGKGNDQVRFELAFSALAPSLQVIAPWKNEEFLNQFRGRTDLLAYAREKEIGIDFAEQGAPYSMDANLMHVSYEGGILEDPMTPPPAGMFRLSADISAAPESAGRFAIDFEEGVPVALVNYSNGVRKSDPLEVFTYLNAAAGEHGVGRIDIVENRYVGIKSRGIYESPAATVLWALHRDLELLTLDREVLRLQALLSEEMTRVIYNGYWFSPEMEFLKNAFVQSQKNVCGTVHFELCKGNVTVVGRESERSLYNPDLASMDRVGGYNQADAAGFIRVNAVRLRAYSSRLMDKVQ